MVVILLNIYLRTVDLSSMQVSRAKSLNQLDCLVHRKIYFWNKIPNHIKNNNSVKN